MVEHKNSRKTDTSLRSVNIKLDDLNKSKMRICVLKFIILRFVECGSCASLPSKMSNYSISIESFECLSLSIMI